MSIVLEFALFIITGILVFTALVLLGIIVAVRVNDDNEQTVQGYPKCQCKDVNHCNVWCIAKQRFYEDPPEE